MKPATAADQPRLQLQAIRKIYPGVIANDAIDLTVQPGEIHALLGENGAGKSTLMKIVYGALQADSGIMRLNGEMIHLSSPQEARALGISMVFQHFSLFDTLTVAENVWLGLEKSLSLQSVRQQITDVAKRYGLDIDTERPVLTLAVGQMQRVEIIRALLSKPQLLILDEPTSVLTPLAIEKLFDVLRQIAADGCSILYISHKLHEVRSLCTKATILRNGKLSGVCQPQQETIQSLSRMMIGGDTPSITKPSASNGVHALEVTHLSVTADDPFGTHLEDVSFFIRCGEVLGIAGVSGNGQGELLRALVGEHGQTLRGSIVLNEQDITSFSVQQKRAAGISFVPEERLGRGAVPPLSLAENLLLTRGDSVGILGWINRRVLRQQARIIIDKYDIKAKGSSATAASLSGGNLQKYIVGREIEAAPKLLILSQPTWGVDVGAAAHIRQKILALRADGCAVLVISDELDELFEIADRLHVIANGRLSPTVDTHHASTTQIGEWMSGLWPKTVVANHA